MAGCLFGTRQTAKADHPLKDLFAQRVASIACGYSDRTPTASSVIDSSHPYARAASSKPHAVKPIALCKASFNFSKPHDEC
jgi:hypothetical protein